MPDPRAQTVFVESSVKSVTQQQKMEQPQSLLVSLRNYALTGGAASLLLGLVELVDLNYRLTPVFESFVERIILFAYFSMNLLGGLVIGLLVGFFASAFGFLRGASERALARVIEARSGRRLLAGLSIAALAAFAMNQQHHINRYVIGLLREAEKIPFLKDPLLNHEKSVSYLTLMGLVIACALVWTTARASVSMGRLIEVGRIVALATVIAAAYFIDSRVEVPTYQATLHVSMFLLSMALAMVLVATTLAALASTRAIRLKRSTLVVAVVVLVGALVFTFASFDRNQNLKTQVFTRTTQARQHFKLIQWALDFDRDTYSALLGGGDADDRRAAVNPGQPEIVGDGIDNNCIGGDLTQRDIDDWKREHSDPPAAVGVPPQRLNVIFIFIDALRADHLGAYGYHRNTSPNIDRLAARSCVFDNAFTPAPNTFEALPKFMQSSYWDGHFETWTEALARNGYNALLFPRRITTLRRHVKGMKEAHEFKAKELATTIDVAIDLLGSAPSDRPFCAYLYATDPHRRYIRHEKFDFGASMVDLYDGEIAATDFQFGRLFDWMQQTGRTKDTMIVIMADHGESLGERGVYKHSSQLYNEQARVPIIIYVPGLAPRRITDYVSTVDLGATILSAAGIPRPTGYAGVSLLPLMRGEAFTHPPVYGEQVLKQDSPYVRPQQNVHPESRKYMVITQDGYKLIYNRNSYSFELFDLNSDPREERNLYDRLPAKAEEMKRLLGRFIDILWVSRPWDADESQYFYRGAQGDDDEM